MAAVINVRVEDHVRDELKDLADEAGVSLSEYVRDLLREVVVPVSDDRKGRHGDQPAPDSLRLIDRQLLSLLHRILGRVLPVDANDDDGDLDFQLSRARTLEAGFTGEYWREAAGFETELSKRDCRRVTDILTMFRNITFSVKHHADEGSPIDGKLVDRLEYAGFDRNDALEGHMASYIEYFMKGGLWPELKPFVAKHDDGNSHIQMLDIYSRMLAEYRRIMDSRERRYTQDQYLLSPEELAKIAEVKTHPSRRRAE